MVVQAKGPVCGVLPLTDTWLVTGAGSGVGRSLAVSLAKAGKSLVLTSKSLSGLEETRSLCGDQVAVELIAADLSEAGQVLKLVESVRRKFDKLEGIAHCAGVLSPRAPQNSVGLDVHLAVNYLAAFLLDEGLIDLLVAHGKSRVLLVAGFSVTLKSIRPEPSFWFDQKRVSPFSAIGWAAAAKVFHARSLHARYGSLGVSAFAFHPGLVRSKLVRSWPWAVRTLAALAQPFLSKRCRTGEFLALEEQARTFSGSFVQSNKPLPNVPVPADSKLENDLWNWSRTLLGL